MEIPSPWEGNPVFGKEKLPKRLSHGKISRKLVAKDPSPWRSRRGGSSLGQEKVPKKGVSLGRGNWRSSFQKGEGIAVRRKVGGNHKKGAR